MSLNIEQHLHQIQKSKGINISETKAMELDKIIQNLSDEKADLEKEHFDMRAEYRRAKDTLDAANAKAE